MNLVAAIHNLYSTSSKRFPALICLCALLILQSGCDSSSGDGIDPGIIEIPIAFIKRPIPVDDQGDPIQADLREPRLFSSGGDVYLRTDSESGSNVTNITSSVTGGIGDVKGLNYSYDGSKLIFSLRLFDLDPDNPPFPSWNIYEYELENGTLRRIINDQVTAELGDDLFPAYLPDGRIVFSSSRQTQSGEMRLSEIKGQYSALDEDEDTVALVLHVMTDAGSDLHQISFNQSHDLRPRVMSSLFGGQVIFSRWDNAAGNNEVNIYKSNPDGSELEILYGARSHATGTGGANIHFTGIREMGNGDLMAIAKPFTGTYDGGDIVVIDVDRFVDINKPIWSQEQTGLTGPAQYPATVTAVNTTSNGISPSGRYSSAFPIPDGSNRVLVSKSNCQVRLPNLEIHPCLDTYVKTPGAEEVSPVYSIWLYDMDQDTEKPLVLADPGIVVTEAIALMPIPRPPVIFDKGVGQLNSSWEDDIVGVVNIRSVYDMGDTTFNGCFLNLFNLCAPPIITTVQDFADPLVASASDRPARFVRFVKAVGIPDPDDPLVTNPDLANTAFGPQRNRGMREIVGYAPVEPDGSVKVRVPANVPLGVEVLDAEGRRIGPVHDNWFQVQPGDTLTCVGCHDLDNSGAPPEAHGRSDAVAPSINDGLQTGTYANTQIPTTLSPYSGSLGETMAEVRFASVPLTTPITPEPRVSPDLLFEDYWTDPTLGTPDPLLPLSYSYDDLDLSLQRPTNIFCNDSLADTYFICRVTINYPDHIHPLWGLPRGVAGADTCTNCHTTNNGAQEAAGQLELTGGPSDQEADHLVSYRELLFTDDNQNFDAVAMMLIEDPTITINPSMTNNGARRSYFMEKLTGDELDDFGRTIAGAVDHTVFMSDAELKMISEWLDVGAQYFNSPFAPGVPQN